MMYGSEDEPLPLANTCEGVESGTDHDSAPRIGQIVKIASTVTAITRINDFIIK